jgi:hypothetical protein
MVRFTWLLTIFDAARSIGTELGPFPARVHGGIHVLRPVRERGQRGRRILCALRQTSSGRVSSVTQRLFGGLYVLLEVR